MQRRQFLKSSALALSATTANAALPAFAKSVHSDETTKPLRVGVVGAGWYGQVDLFRLLQVTDADVVALCDVDRQMVERAAKLTTERQKSGGTPRLYGDYRKMLSDHEFDIVINSTPDHWHALPTIAACAAGADVYCQKPVSVDVTEGEAMVAAARKYNRIVQVGTQRRSTPHLLQARDRYVDSGRMGDIGFVEIFSYFRGRHSVDPTIAEPPEWFDFEMWTGPAPLRPFMPAMHPIKWRAFKEYGNGAIGDLCVHFLDLVRYFLKLGWPRTIACVGGILVDTDNVSNVPDTQTAIFDYGDLAINWTNRTWGRPNEDAYPWAVVLHGSTGKLKMNLHQYEFQAYRDGKPVGEVERGDYLQEEVTELEKQEFRFEAMSAGATRRHMQDFVASIKSRELPVADIQEGHISSATCILANVAMELGRSLRLDPKTGRPVNDEEATKLLARPYRQPWQHPTPENV